MSMFEYFGALFIWAQSQASPPAVVINLDTIPVVAEKTKFVNFNSIHSVGINKVGYGYLGIRGAIPKTGMIDWNKNVNNLWKQKLRMQSTPAAKKAASLAVYSYTSKPAETMNISAHISQLDRHLIAVKQSMEWSKLCKGMRVRDCDSFARAAMSIDANMITAYSMTELMPYQNGAQNYEMMNLYMRYAGRNYLDAIPSLGDPYLSMGRYQFTSYAVGHDKDGLRPTNKIAKYSITYRAPQSVIALKGLSSDRAAYFFSVYNVASLFRAMSPKQVETYNRYCNQKEPLTEYIATSHHNPSKAKNNMLVWINGRCSKPLINYQNPDLRMYSKKTSVNYSEILKRNRLT